MKTLFFIAAIALSVALPASAQPYHSDALLMTNTFIAGGTAVSTAASTNFVLANYAASLNGTAVVQGGGVFPILPGGQDAFFSSQGGVTFQMIYQEVNQTNPLGTVPTQGQTTNVNLIFQPLLDDDTLQKLGILSNVTNTAAFTVAMPILPVSTNGWNLSIVQVPATNFVGCKYAKLIGANGIFTNGILIRTLRAGYFP